MSALNPHTSFWQTFLLRIRHDRLRKFALFFLIFIGFLFVFADFLANEKPIVCKINDEWYFPIFADYGEQLGIYHADFDFEKIEAAKLASSWRLPALIPYSPHNIDQQNDQLVSPFEKQNITHFMQKHWLGTDQLGHDVLSGMIHGSRIAVSVGVFSMSIAFIVGIIIGAMAGYFGDKQIKISIAKFIMLFPAAFFAFFTCFISLKSDWEYALKNGMVELFQQFLLCLLVAVLWFLLSYGGAYLLEKIKPLNKKIYFPLDLFLSRFIEIIESIPVMFLILSFVAIAKPSLSIVILIIGLTSWSSIARFTRAEFLKVRQLEYIEAASALGYPQWRIILIHALPNALSPVLISLAFGIAGAILVESTLSFMGIGLPADKITWGSLLASARQAPQAWWLALSPGIAIFLTVSSLNIIGDTLSEILNPFYTYNSAHSSPPNA